MSRPQDAPEVPLDEALARMRQPLTDDERAETLALVAWFTRRYPTLSDRFAYVRKRHAEWTSTPLVKERREPGPR